MYLVLWIVLLGLGVLLVGSGVAKSRRPRIVGGAAVIVLTPLFFALISLWGEMLWFEALGMPDRFWRMVGYRTLALGLGLVIGAGVAWLLSASWRREKPTWPWWPTLIGGLIGLLWGNGVWNELVLAIHGPMSGIEEPILGRDASFYMFVLPLLQSVAALGVMLVVLGLASEIGGWLIRQEEQKRDVSLEKMKGPSRSFVQRLRPHGSALAIVLLLVLFVQSSRLLFSTSGVVTGPGWTDVHVRLPAYGLVALVVALAGIAPWLQAFRKRLKRVANESDDPRAQLVRAGVPWVTVALIWILALGIAPVLFQWLVVEPNEITFERPYIENNIRFTRQAFELDGVEEYEFPMDRELDREIVREHQNVLDDVRLWDWRALDMVYQQFQEIRLYYEFGDVDVDRYQIEGETRQVMVSARELELENLPEKSKTFVNRRFKYTHGYGLTLAPVNEFTSNGLPDLLVKDIPPRSETPELDVTRPGIYYGERSTSPALVNTSETEFDYPSGDENVYTHYEGSGGVPIGGLWRRFIYGWKFDGTRLLVSSYPREGSRIQFHRQIRDRLEAVAPFLEFDADPYVVLVDGKIYWIVDAYTTSSHFPYSAPFTALEEIEYAAGGEQYRMAARTASYLRGANYARNSVKAVIDAYEGSVDLYVFEPEDPVLNAWRSAFPGVFRDRSEMPDDLERHIRYPEGLLLAQGLVYARYHMTDPEVFYNQEDLWVRATENYYGNLQPVAPYYILWEPPESEEVNFVLMLPFTPKNRQVLIGWMAGLCDPPNYGKLVAYKFPKERRVLGPQQVETKIDQDRHLASQLTLWDQRGSRVIRGNVLAIPIDDTLLYVEPIYLQAETAAYPELRLVAVMHEDTLSYAPSFEEALRGLYAGEAPVERTGVAGSAAGTLAERIGEAKSAFDRYLRLNAEGRFEEAGRALGDLQNALESLDRDQAADDASVDDRPGKEEVSR